VRRQGKCIPDELKQRVTTWLIEQRALGVPLKELAAQLGLAYRTVRRWSQGRGRRAIVPVRVVAEADAQRTVRASSGPILRTQHSATRAREKSRQQRTAMGGMGAPAGTRIVTARSVPRTMAVACRKLSWGFACEAAAEEH